MLTLGVSSDKSCSSDSCLSNEEQGNSSAIHSPLTQYLLTTPRQGLLLVFPVCDPVFLPMVLLSSLLQQSCFLPLLCFGVFCSSWAVPSILVHLLHIIKNIHNVDSLIPGFQCCCGFIIVFILPCQRK
jgi:hypothetical protein